MKNFLKNDEKKLIDYIKKNIDECLKIGVVGIADLNNVSPSKIIRLSKKLGYTGYIDMIYSFKNKIKNENFLKINNETKYTVRKKNEINMFINSLINNRVLVFGEDFSGLIGKYISNRLISLGIE